MQVPTRNEVRAQLLALLSGASTREQLADWAAEWVRMDDPPVDDPVVWSALRHFAGADLQTSPGEYLHHDVDFHVWLDEVENAMGEV